jgi:hypothetical protein
MPRRRSIPGRLLRTRHDWAPLIALVGLDLVDWFMAMHAVELLDGTVVRAYKHRSTRRYLHLAPDGRAFEYLESDRYREWPVSEAVERAFYGWERVLPEPQPADLAALERLRCRADSASAVSDSGRSRDRT